MDDRILRQREKKDYKEDDIRDCNSRRKIKAKRRPPLKDCYVELFDVDNVQDDSDYCKLPAEMSEPEYDCIEKDAYFRYLNLVPKLLLDQSKKYICCDWPLRDISKRDYGAKISLMKRPEALTTASFDVKRHTILTTTHSDHHMTSYNNVHSNIDRNVDIGAIDRHSIVNSEITNGGSPYGNSTDHNNVNQDSDASSHNGFHHGEQQDFNRLPHPPGPRFYLNGLTKTDNTGYNHLPQPSNGLSYGGQEPFRLHVQQQFDSHRRSLALSHRRNFINKISNNLDFSSTLGQKVLESEPGLLIRKKAHLLDRVFSYEEFCGVDDKRSIYTPCDVPSSTVRNPNNRARPTSSRLPSIWERQYCFSKTERLQRYKTLQTGLDWQSRLLLMSCKDCYVHLERTDFCSGCHEILDETDQADHVCDGQQ